MSSADPRRGRQRGARVATDAGLARILRAAVVAAAVAGLPALAGCVARPLYADMPGSGTPVSAELAKIAIQPAENSVEQAFRNELVFGFTGGGPAGPPDYALRFFLTTTDSAVAIQELSEVPAAYFVELSASFVLTDARTGRTLLTGTSVADASYNFSSQRFANVRAREDAERRAAKTIAGDIRTRLAAFFATRKPAS